MHVTLNLINVNYLRYLRTSAQCDNVQVREYPQQQFFGQFAIDQRFFTDTIGTISVQGAVDISAIAAMAVTIASAMCGSKYLL